MISSVNTSIPIGLATSAHDTHDTVAASATFRARADAVARIAESRADAVDRDAAFPEAAFAEIRRQRLLGIMVPRHLGGESAPFSEIVDVCYRLGQACASTAMIYAMHQVKMACIVRYVGEGTALEAYLSRIAREQLLLASSTTEGSAGGNVRASEAPVEQNGDQIRLTRQASCISYALNADGIVTTARRSPQAAVSDQVLLVFPREQYRLEPTVGWDTLGMRGTCSEGFTLYAEGTSANIVPVAYERIHQRSMVPAAHLMWSAAWAGAAAAAVGRAQAFVRTAARQSQGRLPPGTPHLGRAVASLRTLVALLASSLENYERLIDDETALGSLEFQTAITLTKVQASELAVETVLGAMRTCGLAGYRNDGAFSVARHLRDVLSAPIMINNDRILANLAPQTLLAALPTAIRA
jgi:acyl-CoA dehydrogenase